MPAAPTLTDGSVTLRAHRLDDARGSYEQCQDPASQRWTTVPIPYSLEDAEPFVGRIMPAGWADDSEWGFAVEHDGRYAGTVSLRNVGSGRGEVAYGSHPGVRGTDVMERALRLLLDWGFETRELRTVIWWAHRGNWPSRRLAWKLGFRVEGTVRHWQPQRGELITSWVGTLLRDDPRSPATPWLECPVIEREGLRLRPVEPRDAERIAEASADERTQRWLGHLPTPYMLADAQAYVEGCSEVRANGTGVTWAVVDPADDLVLATVLSFRLKPGLECELGYWTHPEARGRGLMTRALRVVVEYAFDELGVRRVKACIAVGNVASRHLVEANGLRLYGVERLGADTGSGPEDLALYDLTVEEFAAARAPALL